MEWYEEGYDHSGELNDSQLGLSEDEEAERAELELALYCQLHFDPQDDNGTAQQDYGLPYVSSHAPMYSLPTPPSSGIYREKVKKAKKRKHREEFVKPVDKVKKHSSEVIVSFADNDEPALKAVKTKLDKFLTRASTSEGSKTSTPVVGRTAELRKLDLPALTSSPVVADNIPVIDVSSDTENDYDDSWIVLDSIEASGSDDDTTSRSCIMVDSPGDKHVKEVHVSPRDKQLGDNSQDPILVDTTQESGSNSHIIVLDTSQASDSKNSSLGNPTGDSSSRSPVCITLETTEDSVRKVASPDISSQVLDESGNSVVASDNQISTRCKSDEPEDIEVSSHHDSNDCDSKSDNRDDSGDNASSDSASSDTDSSDSESSSEEEWSVAGFLDDLEDAGLLTNIAGTRQPLPTAAASHQGGYDIDIEGATLQEVHDSLGDCDWGIDPKDRYASVKTMARYYRPFEVTCHNCGTKGHLSKCCPKPKKVQTCILCGLPGHLFRGCPEPACFNCDHIGHMMRDCEGPRRRLYDTCYRCSMRGHLKQNCTDLWRQFHMTTVSGEICRMKEKPNTQKSCFNCSSNRHFGYECHVKPGPHNTFAASQFISTYDRAEHVTRGRAREDMHRTPNKARIGKSQTKEQPSESKSNPGVDCKTKSNAHLQESHHSVGGAARYSIPNTMSKKSKQAAASSTNSQPKESNHNVGGTTRYSIANNVTKKSKQAAASSTNTQPKESNHNVGGTTRYSIANNVTKKSKQAAASSTETQPKESNHNVGGTTRYSIANNVTKKAKQAAASSTKTQPKESNRSAVGTTRYSIANNVTKKSKQAAASSTKTQPKESNHSPVGTTRYSIANNVTKKSKQAAAKLEDSSPGGSGVTRYSIADNMTKKKRRNKKASSSQERPQKIQKTEPQLTASAKHMSEKKTPPQQNQNKNKNKRKRNRQNAQTEKLEYLFADFPRGPSGALDKTQGNMDSSFSLDSSVMGQNLVVRLNAGEGRHPGSSYQRQVDVATQESAQHPNSQSSGRRSPARGGPRYSPYRGRGQGRGRGRGMGRGRGGRSSSGFYY